MSSNVPPEVLAKLESMQPIWRIARPATRDAAGKKVYSTSAIEESVFADDGKTMPILRSFSDIEEREIDWLWPGHFPRDMVSMIVGEEGVGKSFVTIDMAARVSAGAPWPDGSGNAPHGKVILIAGEDHPECVIAGRLRNAGADKSKVRIMDGVLTPDKRLVQFHAKDQLLALDLAVAGVAPCHLVIIDPVNAFMGDSDQNAIADVRDTLNGLVLLAARRHVAIVLVSHWNKGNGNDKERVIGSRGFNALSRSTWTVKQDKKTRECVFMQTKCNIASWVSGQYFGLDSSGKMTWGDPCTARDTREAFPHLAAGVQNRKESNPRRAKKSSPGVRAEKQLHRWLSFGKRRRSILIEKWAAAGNCENTLKSAARRLGVVSSFLESNRNKGVWWSLPE